MKIAFVSIKNENSTSSNNQFVTTTRIISDESLEYGGVDGFIRDFVSDSITKSAIDLLNNIEADHVVFDLPIVLKSKTDRTEVGFDGDRNKYIWELKQEYKKLVIILPEGIKVVTSPIQQ